MTVQAHNVAHTRCDAVGWVKRWFADHGFDAVPVERWSPATLTVSVLAEFEAWCERESITPRVQRSARRAADQQLRRASAPDGPLRDAARDIAAWASLRDRPPRCR